MQDGGERGRGSWAWSAQRGGRDLPGVFGSLVLGYEEVPNPKCISAKQGWEPAVVVREVLSGWEKLLVWLLVWFYGENSVGTALERW